MPAGETYLPAGPFRDWLLEQRRREAERMHVSPEQANHLVAAHLGVAPRTVREYLRPRKLVALSTVDQAVTKSGTWSIGDVYGFDVLEHIRIYEAKHNQHMCSGCGSQMQKRAKLCGFCNAERRNRRCIETKRGS